MLVLRAGLEGLRNDFDPAPVIDGELDLEAEHQNLPELPSSLEEALQVLETGTNVQTWFSEDFISNYLAVKRDEISCL